MVVAFGGLRNVTLAAIVSLIFLLIYLTGPHRSKSDGKGPHDAFSSVQAKNDFYGIPKTDFRLPTMAEESEKYFRTEAEREAKRKGEEAMLKKSTGKTEGSSTESVVPKIEDDIDYEPPHFKPAGGVQKLRRYNPHNYKGPGNPTFATYYSVASTSLREPTFVSIYHMAYRLLWDDRTRSTKHPFTVFVAPDTCAAKRDLLSAMGVLVRDLDPLVPSGSTATDMLPPNFDLINLWSQTHFSRILYLHPMVHIVRGIDELFEKAEMRMCDEEKLGMEDRESTGKGICKFTFAAVPNEAGKGQGVDAAVMVLNPNSGMRRRLGREVGKILGVVEDKKQEEGARPEEKVKNVEMSKEEYEKAKSQAAEQRPNEIEQPVTVEKKVPGEAALESNADQKPVPGQAALTDAKLKPGEKPVAVENPPAAGEKSSEGSNLASNNGPPPAQKPVPGEAGIAGAKPRPGSTPPAANSDLVTGEPVSSDARVPAAGSPSQAAPGAPAAPVPPGGAFATVPKPDARQESIPVPGKIDTKALMIRSGEAQNSQPHDSKSLYRRDDEETTPAKPKTLSLFLTTQFAPSSAFPFQPLARIYNGREPVTGDDEKVLKVMNKEIWRNSVDGEEVEWPKGLFRRMHDGLQGLMEREEGRFEEMRRKDGERPFL